MENQFNEDYFERGVEKNLSGYTNYKYMPTRSYEEASTLIERWGIYDWIIDDEGNDKDVPYKILDYGCAKGFLVHSLRQLGYEAYGYDISEYAINNCVPDVKEYLSNDMEDELYDYVVCKDVMEHIPENEVLNVLSEIYTSLKTEALFVIPLGDDNKFRIREYEIDVTHVTKKDEDWWINRFKESGFEIVDFKYSFGAIKKKWQHYDHGNGFFFVKPKDRRVED